MSLTRHSRPDLRPAILELLAVLVPAVRDGGAVPLTAIVFSAVGARLTPAVRSELDARGDVHFSCGAGGTSFINEGPATKVELKRFGIKLATRLAGHARLVEDGAILNFSGSDTLSVTKFFFSVRLENLEVTSRRVFVDLEGDSFDQTIELV